MPDGVASSGGVPSEASVLLEDMTEAVMPAERKDMSGPPVPRACATAPLRTLLLSTEHEWGTAQEQIWALAHALHAAGRHAVGVCCPVDSALAHRLRAQPTTQTPAQTSSLTLVPLSSRHTLLAVFRLWRCQQRKLPLLLHAFDTEALQLAERLTRIRRLGSTLVLHSCFTSPVSTAAQGDGATRKAKGGATRGPMPTDSANRAWRAVDRILCANVGLRSLLADSGLDVARLMVVHPGCDTAALPARQPRGDGRFVFVAVEELHPGTGLFVLLRAMAALWQRVDLPPWEVRVVGTGNALMSILDEARSLGVEARLALLSRQDLGEVLPRCDAMLVPHRLPYGNMGALMAAWCSRLPLVCTDTAVHLEVVRPARTALCVPAGDAQALAAAMIRLLTEPALCVQLASEGADMQSYAGYARMVTQTLAHYASCLARRGWVLPPASSTSTVTPASLASSDTTV